MIRDLYPSRVSDTPHKLHRMEPVCYGLWNDSAPLTPAQIEFYDENGFLVLDDVFDAEEVALLNDEARLLRLARGDMLEAGTTIKEPGSSATRSIFRVHGQSPIFARLAADARLAEIARFALDDDIYIHQSRLNYKPGFTGKEFYWHSDFETWHVEDGMPRMRALSMSVLLTENTPQNGPLMLIPGSHKHFIACVGETPDDHFRQSLKKQEYGVPDDASLAGMVCDAGIAAPTGEPGSVIIFDCNTMHGSNSNITPLPRANAFLVYNAVSNALTAPFGAKKPRPDFIATRGSTTPVVPIHGRITKRAA